MTCVIADIQERAADIDLRSAGDDGVDPIVGARVPRGRGAIRGIEGGNEVPRLPRDGVEVPACVDDRALGIEGNDGSVGGGIPTGGVARGRIEGGDLAPRLTANVREDSPCVDGRTVYRKGEDRLVGIGIPRGDRHVGRQVGDVGAEAQARDSRVSGTSSGGRTWALGQATLKFPWTSMTALGVTSAADFSTSR